jgi:hypothetical protein
MFGADTIIRFFYYVGNTAFVLPGAVLTESQKKLHCNRERIRVNRLRKGIFFILGGAKQLVRKIKSTKKFVIKN